MWHGDVTWWGWLLMSVGMVAFWGVVIAVLVYLVRGDWRRDRSPSPREILDARLARGEIDADEHRERLQALRDAHPSEPARAR